MKRRKRKLPVWLSQEEVDRLLEAAQAKRDKLLILLGCYAGLRVSEMVNLRIERINFERGELLIYQSKGGKDRLLPLSPKLSEPLKAWIGERKEGWVFPSPVKPERPLTTRSVQYMIRDMAARAGITRPDPTQRISPHKLRHTFCSRLFERGIDVAAVRDLMGHSNLSTTDIYAHTTTERLRGAVHRL